MIQYILTYCLGEMSLRHMTKHCPSLLKSEVIIQFPGSPLLIHTCKILWLGGMNENQQWIGGGEGQVMTKTIYRLKGEVSQVFWPGLSLITRDKMNNSLLFFFSHLQFTMKQFYILHQKPCLLQVRFLGLCYSLLAHLPFFLALYEQYFSV